MASIATVLADDHVADGLGRGDVRGLGLPGDGREGTRLADPDQALVGADAHEDIVGRLHLADGDAERSDEGQVIDVDLDVFDGHLGRAGASFGGSGAGQREAESAETGGQTAEAEDFQELLAGQAHEGSSRRDFTTIYSIFFNGLASRKKCSEGQKKRRNRL
jgi:hypothetical protein